MTAYRSDTIGTLSKALALAQGAYKPLIENDNDGHLPFANIEAVIQATRQALSENHVAFNQWTELTEEGAKILWTEISHDNEYIRTSDRLFSTGTDKLNDARNAHIRRQQASYLLGIAPSRNDPSQRDDNGESQNQSEIMSDLINMNAGKQQASPSKYIPITKDQHKDILIEVGDYKEIARGVMISYKIDSLADLPSTEYHRTLQEIRRIKQQYRELDEKKY
jgi:hypothetical protein